MHAHIAYGSGTSKCSSCSCDTSSPLRLPTRRPTPPAGPPTRYFIKENSLGAPGDL